MGTRISPEYRIAIDRVGSLHSVAMCSESGCYIDYTNKQPIIRSSNSLQYLTATFLVNNSNENGRLQNRFV